MSHVKLRCLICRAPLPPPVRINGRPREYCSRACRRIQARRKDYAYRQRVKLGLTVPREGSTEPRPKPQPSQPVSWWVAQAEAIRETCRVCEGPVEGVYVAPTQGTVGECAGVAHCRMCGRERVIIAGRMGVPYAKNEPI